MSLRVILQATFVAGLVGVTGIAHAGPITVDGSLLDWGVVTDAGHKNWTVSNGPKTFRTYNGFTYEYIREDSSDSAGDDGFVGPNRGGQNYDTEFIAAGIYNNVLYISIVTGQRRDNGAARFAPGDIYIEANSGLFGVEVGGGYGDTAATNVTVRGSAASGFVSDPGSTYFLESNGFTKTPSSAGHISSTQVAASPSHVAGSVWKTESTDWILDPIATGTPDEHWPIPGHVIGKDPVQLQLAGGDYVGQAEFYYNMSSYLGKDSNNKAQKAVIEVAIPLSFFGTTAVHGITWAPSCGNDILHLPEPATFGMLLMGALGIAGIKRFRREEA